LTMEEKYAKIEVMKLKPGDLVRMELGWGAWPHLPFPKNKSMCFGIVLETDNNILFKYARVRWFNVKHLYGQDKKNACPRKSKDTKWEIIDDLQKISTLTNEIEDATLSIE